MFNLTRERFLFVLSTLIILMLMTPTTVMAAWDSTEYGTNVTNEQRSQNTPAGWTAVQLPSITSHGEYDITKYGASTTSADNSTAINDAIAAANTAGGGIVVIPAGTWMVGKPLDIKSNVVLHLSENCTLKMQPKGVYPAGKDNYFISNRTQSSVDNVIIEGEGETSVIDGNGTEWWPNYKSTEEADIRPGSIIRIKKGSNHLFRNFKITRAPQTNLTLGMSGNVNDVTVHDVWILNPPAESDLLTAQGMGFTTASHNTDGIPVWGNHINIYNCDINTGDDNIVCDDGANFVHAWNIKCGCGHGMSVGSNTKNVHDIIYENITFNNTTSGFRIKSDPSKSGNDQVGNYGAVKNIICRNATMTGVRNPIKITSWYDADVQDASTVSTPSTITETTPEFCNITFQNITADAVTYSFSSWKHGAPVYIYGRPEMKIHDITLDNVQVSSKSNTMYLAYCENVTFKNKCLVKTGSSVTSPYIYDASYSGTFNGTANATYDDAGTSPVYFNNGDYTVYTTTVLNGQTVDKPSDPTDDDKTFVGWSDKKGSITTVSFPYTVSAATTFYAVWEGDTEESGETGEGGETGGEETLPVTQSDVSGAKTWDWSEITGSDIQWTASTTPNNTTDVIMKNISGLTFGSNFDAQAIVVKGEYPYRKQSTQNTTIKFRTTVAGKITVDFGDTGASIANGSTATKRYLNVNGQNTTYYTQRTGSSNDKKTSGEIEVPAGDVVITGMQEDGSKATSICIYKIVFTPTTTTDPSEPSYDKTLSNNTYTVASGDKAVSGTKITGTDVTMTYGNDTWKDAATEKTTPTGYTYYITGTANPSPSNVNVPSAGCYYKFEPTKDGTLNVAMLVNASKAIYVVENGTSIGYSIDGTGYSAGSSLAAKTGGILSFPVTSGKTYYVYCSGSKLGLFGWTFAEGTGTPDTPDTPTGSTVTGTETTPTAKASNADQVGLCYTVPATYVGGQGNFSKAIKFNLRNDKIEINVNPNYTITGFTFTGNDNYATDGITINSVTVDGGSTNVLSSGVTFATDKSENSFTISDIAATQKITLTAATPHDSQLNGTIIFTYEYKVQPLALQSEVKTSSRNGSVTLKFNNPMAAVNGTATLNGKTLTADVEGTSLKFVYEGLDYSQTYTFTVSSGVLKDEFNQTYDKPISIMVTTDARPTTTKKAFDLIVSNADELAAAIKAANDRADKASRYRIFIKNGNYKLYGSGEEKTVEIEYKNGSKTSVKYPNPTTILTGQNVSLIGENYANVTITNNTDDFDTFEGKNGEVCIAEGIGRGDVLQISKDATESYFQGITIKSSMGDNRGRDIAVNDQSNKTIMKDVCLWGYQDTYVSNNSNGRFYFDGGVLRGRTDYLCGKGDVYYNKVTLQQVGTGGYLAVPSVPLKYGYIFNECYIKKETNDVTYYLGRPWGQGTPIALFINTKVDAAPLADGWAEMSNGWPARFAEYGTKTTNGTAVPTSGRKTTFASSHTNNPNLTAVEAAYYSNMARIMGGTDGWDPTEHTEQCDKPNAQLSGSTLSWNDDNYASSWIVFKDGEYYANPITNSISLTEAGEYTVRAANNMGGLGEASDAVELVAPSEITLSEDNNYDSFTEGTYTVNLKRTFGENEWTSLVVPFDVTAEQVKKSFGNDTKVAEVTKLDDSGLHYKNITEIKANVPVLIKVAETKDTYTFAGVTVKNATANAVATSDDGTKLVGLYKKTSYDDLDEKLYFLYGGKFYDHSYLATLSPFRAYILPPTGFVASAKGISFVKDENVSGIVQTELQDTCNGAIYNIAGQRIAKPSKGVFIQNGKKYNVK